VREKRVEARGLEERVPLQLSGVGIERVLY